MTPRAKSRLYAPPGDRHLRVGEVIRSELADIVRRHMRDPRVNTSELSFNEVLLSRDLSRADIYVSSMQSSNATEQAQLTQVLQAAAGFLRTRLAKRQVLRTIPALHFHYDTIETEAAHLDSLIRKLKLPESRGA